MLREHLSQAHDAASRRGEKIDRHVAWIHEALLGGTPARILDLGCGPGLYAARLAGLGHTCRGIDFSPASLRYAREQAEARSLPCTYVEGDLRSADFGGDHDLAILLYGELNVFAPDDARLILRRARAALRPGGRLLLEPHTEVAIRGMADEPRTWFSSPSSVYAEVPHLVLTEQAWHDERRCTMIRRYVLDAATGAVERLSQTMQAYAPDDYRALLAAAGFDEVAFYASLTGRDEDAEPGLVGVTAVAAP